MENKEDSINEVTARHSDLKTEFIVLVEVLVLLTEAFDLKLEK